MRGRGYYRGYKWPNEGIDPLDPRYDPKFDDEEEWYDRVESILEDRADDRRCGL